MVGWIDWLSEWEWSIHCAVLVCPGVRLASFSCLLTLYIAAYTLRTSEKHCGKGATSLLHCVLTRFPLLYASADQKMPAKQRHNPLAAGWPPPLANPRRYRSAVPSSTPARRRVAAIAHWCSWSTTCIAWCCELAHLVEEVFTQYTTDVELCLGKAARPLWLLPSCFEMKHEISSVPNGNIQYTLLRLPANAYLYSIYIPWWKERQFWSTLCIMKHPLVCNTSLSRGMRRKLAHPKLELSNTTRKEWITTNKCQRSSWKIKYNKIRYANFPS